MGYHQSATKLLVSSNSRCFTTLSQCHFRLTTWIRLILYITPYQHLISTSHTHNVSVNSTFALLLLVIVVPTLNKILSYLIFYLYLNACTAYLRSIGMRNITPCTTSRHTNLQAIQIYIDTDYRGLAHLCRKQGRAVPRLALFTSGPTGISCTVAPPCQKGYGGSVLQGNNIKCAVLFRGTGPTPPAIGADYWSVWVESSIVLLFVCDRQWLVAPAGRKQSQQNCTQVNRDLILCQGIM